MDSLVIAEERARHIVDEYNQRNEFHILAGNEGEWTLENYICQFELASVKVQWLNGELVKAEERIRELETLVAKLYGEVEIQHREEVVVVIDLLHNSMGRAPCCR